MKLSKSNCDYNDAYILVMGDITAVEAGNAKVTGVAFKIDGATIDDLEELDLVMPIYNLIEYNLNYSDTDGNLWFYSKDEATDFNNDIAYTVILKSFKYKAKFLGNAEENEARGISRKATIAAPLKYLSNFWRNAIG